MDYVVSVGKIGKTEVEESTKCDDWSHDTEKKDSRKD